VFLKKTKKNTKSPSLCEAATTKSAYCTTIRWYEDATLETEIAVASPSTAEDSIGTVWTGKSSLISLAKLS